MSIDTVLQVALSALNTSQAALRTASSNIANVNTEGYARRVLIQETQVVGTEGSGVRVAEVRRIVDAFLIDELRNASSEAKAADVQASFHDRIQALLGGPDDENTLGARLNQMFVSLADLTVDANSAVRRAAAINDLEAFGDEVSRLAQQVQDLRAEVDRQIQGEITRVNDALKRVQDLNPVIARESLAGRDASALIDQRDQAIDDIANVMDIRISDLGSSTVGVSTVSGVSLLDNVSRKLVYAPPSTVTSSTYFPPITVNPVNPATGVAESTGVPLDASVRSGSLRGYLDMRNGQLPDLAEQLGELAGKVVDQLNGVHNDNTAVPPPNSLVGRNTGLTGADAHGFTGKVTLAVIDSSNGIADSFVVDFASYTTLDQALTAANTALAGNGTLSLSGGVLAFSAVNPANGVALLQDATTPSSRAGRGLAHFFGLNDLMEAKVPAHYDTGLKAADSHRFTGTVSFEVRGPDGDVPGTYTLDFGVLGGTDFTAVVNDLNAKLGAYASFSLDANGKLAITPTSTYAGYDVVTVSDTTNRASTGVTMSQLFGIGPRYRADAALDVKVTSRITTDNKLFALAKLDTGAAAGVPALTVGDNRGALKLQDLVKQTVQFAIAGDLSAAGVTLAEYAALIVSKVSINAENIDRASADSGALKGALEQRLASVSGVNLDEELANMIVFQNAFNASARLIATADEMFDTLLSVI
jgi:flagellar hook-associated protein 1 FlgK